MTPCINSTHWKYNYFVPTLCVSLQTSGHPCSANVLLLASPFGPKLVFSSVQKQHIGRFLQHPLLHSPLSAWQQNNTNRMKAIFLGRAKFSTGCIKLTSWTFVYRRQLHICKIHCLLSLLLQLVLMYQPTELAQAIVEVVALLILGKRDVVAASKDTQMTLQCGWSLKKHNADSTAWKQSYVNACNWS